MLRLDRCEAHATIAEHRCRDTKEQRSVHLTLRWHGGAITEIDLTLQRRPAAVRTDEDTVALVRRLAIHYPDAVIAGILNRQERRTAYGHRFTSHLVGSLRRNWDIPRFESPLLAFPMRAGNGYAAPVKPETSQVPM